MKLFAFALVSSAAAQTCFTTRGVPPCKPNDSVLQCTTEGFVVTVNLDDMFEDVRALTDEQKTTSQLNIGTKLGLF